MKTTELNNTLIQIHNLFQISKKNLHLITQISSLLLACLGAIILTIGCCCTPIAAIPVSIGTALIILSFTLFTLQAYNIFFSKPSQQKLIKPLPIPEKLFDPSSSLNTFPNTSVSKKQTPYKKPLTQLPLLQKELNEASLKKQKPSLFQEELNEANLTEILSQDWRLGLDKNQLPRYLCISYPIGLFLSVRQGGLFTPLSSTPNRPFAVAVDMNNLDNLEKKDLLNLIPAKFLQNIMTQLAFSNNLSCSPKYLDPNLNQPFRLICVKGLDNFPLPDNHESASSEEQLAINETLFNLLKISYIKLLKEAISTRVQILQLTLLQAPFPKLNKKTINTLSQIALLQAIREITQESSTLDLLQEIIIRSDINL